jgi:hypothetical protein
MKAEEVIKKVKLAKRIKKDEKLSKFIEIIKDRVENNEKIVISKIMLEAGYAPSTARTCSVTKNKAFKDLLEEYLPDTSLLGVVRDLVSPTNEDKNNRLAAAKEGFRLKDKYPASKLQLNAFQEATADILEDD